MDILIQEGSTSYAAYRATQAALLRFEADVLAAEARLRRLLKQPVAQEVAEAEARVATAQANLESSQAELEHYTVTAPIDGVVTWLNAVPGMVSRPGTTVWGEIFNLDEIDVQCEVAADQADHITVGQTAKVWRASFPDARWAGEVVSVGVAADERTGLVPVRLRIQDAAERLRCHVEVKVRFGTGSGVPSGN